MITEKAFFSLKPGDKVRVAKDIGSNERAYATNTMEQLEGRIVTVKQSCPAFHIGSYNDSYITIEELGWCWTRFCFDSVISAVEPVGVAELI